MTAALHQTGAGCKNFRHLAIKSRTAQRQPPQIAPTASDKHHPNWGCKAILAAL